MGTCQGRGTFEETQVPILLVSATQGEKAVEGIGVTVSLKLQRKYIVDGFGDQAHIHLVLNVAPFERRFYPQVHPAERPSLWCNTRRVFLYLGTALKD